MKRTLTFCLFAFLGLQLSAQSGINNLDFENWTTIGGGAPTPEGFYSQGASENTSNPYSGSSALKITTTDFNGDTSGLSLIGTISNMSLVQGTDISFCPDSITGYVMYDLPNQDTAVISASVNPAGGGISSSAFLLWGGTQNSWTRFNATFDPIDCGGSTPDSINLIMTSETVGVFQGGDIGTQTEGGYVHFDGLQIWDNGQPQSIEELAQDPSEFGVHPNPASQQVRFEFSDRAERIRIFDMTGRTVQSLSVAQAKGSKQVQVNDLEKGLYLYRVEDENGRQLYSDKLQVVR